MGQALAYTVSTTGGMSAVPGAKAGIASGILSMVRLLGAVFGVATTGALFKAMENGRLAELLSAAGANLDASDRAEIRGLLSGSAGAEQRLSQVAPAAAREIERITREAFVHALDGAMLLCMFVSLAGVFAAFLVAGRAARPPESRASTPGGAAPQTDRV
jgi:ribosomal protein L12E/L44/L45/RPP1/RPP2